MLKDKSLLPIPFLILEAQEEPQLPVFTLMHHLLLEPKQKISNFYDFCKLTESRVRDFYILLTTGMQAQKRQLFGLPGLGFLPTAITLDAYRWSVGCLAPNPCVRMALCLACRLGSISQWVIAGEQTQVFICHLFLEEILVWQHCHATL